MTQEPTTILYVHSSDELYGSDVALLELLRRLNRRRFAPIVVLPKDLPYEAGRARLSDELAQLKVPVVKADFAVLRRRYLTPRGLPHFLMRLLRGTRVLMRLIVSQNVQIVHANTIAVLGGALAARLTGRRLIWHVHEIINNPRWLRWLVARIVTGWADRVVAISSPVADHLLGLGSIPGAARKMTIIPDAVDTDCFHPALDGSVIRAMWGVTSGQVVVGTVGRLNVWKGQGVLLEAAKLLSERPVHFIIAGDIVPGQPEPRDALETAITAGNLRQRVRLIGFWSDIWNVIAALDILVLPSIQPEPFGLVVLQAMACGKPVIATAHGGPTEIVVDGETGLLIRPRNSAALASAIIRLIDDPALRARMGAAGRVRAVEHYGFKQHLTAFEEVYDMLGEPR